MKKAVIGISAAALAAVMCVAFAGCGESGGAEEIKGEIVTEEQWDAAFAALEKDDAQYTVEMNGSSTTTLTVDLTELGGKKSGGTVSVEETGTFINNGARQSLVTSLKTSLTGDFSEEEFAELLHTTPEQLKGQQNEEGYAERDASGKYTLYEKNEEGKWQTSEGGSIDPMKHYDQKGSFDDFKYDETLKGYVEADYEESDPGYTVYKFDGQGRLVAVYVYELFSEPTGGAEMSAVTELNFLFTYTAKEIKLPTVEG